MNALAYVHRRGVIIAATICELPRVIDAGVALHGTSIDAPEWVIVHAIGMAALALVVASEMERQLHAAFAARHWPMRAALGLIVALLAVSVCVSVAPMMIWPKMAPNDPVLRAVAGGAATFAPLLVVIGHALAEQVNRTAAERKEHAEQPPASQTEQAHTGQPAPSAGANASEHGHTGANSDAYGLLTRAPLAIGPEWANSMAGASQRAQGAALGVLSGPIQPSGTQTPEMRNFCANCHGPMAPNRASETCSDRCRMALRRKRQAEQAERVSANGATHE